MPDQLAKRVSLCYGLIGAAWILCSNRVASAFISDARESTRFQTYNGWAFVGITTVLLYAVLSRWLRGRERESTEHRQTEEALRLSAAQLRANLENTPNVAVQWYDEAGRILYWNPASEALYGWKAEEAIGKTLDALIYTPELAAEFLGILHDIRKTGKPAGPYESSFKRRNGSPGWLISTTFGIPMGEGGIGFVCMDVDITERKRAEEESRQLKERFESIFNLSPQSVVISRLDDGLIVDTNEMFLSHNERTREEVMGKSSLQINLWQNPDDRKEFVDHIRKHGFCRDREMIFVRKGGSAYFASVSSAVIDLQGVPHLITISQDITGRKRAEEENRHLKERFESIFNLSPQSIVISHLHDGQIVDVNRMFTLHHGWTREESIGKSTLQIGLWHDQEDQREFVDRIGKGGFYRDHETVLRRKDGSEYFASLSSMAIELQGVPHLISISQDITERKRADQKLMESREQLRILLARLQRAQEEERIRVAREVHDELGQLLTSLKIDVRWLERKLSDPALPPAFNPLLDRAVAASEMADATIVTVQKIAAELRPGALDQLGLAAALTQMARRFEERSDVHCTVAVSEPVQQLPLEIATELYYICQEALTNVARHARARNVEIRLAAEGDGVLLELRDDGVGITESDLNAARSLGLLGMKERARHCNGTIVFQRGDSGGTRISVRIPHAAASTQEGARSR